MQLSALPVLAGRAFFQYNMGQGVMSRDRKVIMKKVLLYLTLALTVVFCMCACASAKTPEPAKTESFSYVHDPTLNPEAMKDIIVNEDAVYGFSPDPASTRLGIYAVYDWTDPALVAKAMAERIEYHDSFKSMSDILDKLMGEGASIEEMARAVSNERNLIRLDSYAGDPEGLAEVKRSNLATYGHEEGPTPDELFEKYGSWEIVMQKAFSPNLGMDACCGLYDMYYDLYVVLGLATE